MDNPQTCGQGLAEHSAVPAKMAELIDALADNLELHMTALDLSDGRSVEECEAYASLVGQHRTIAAGLKTAAGQMAGYRDMPMGEHDAAAMNDPEIREAFERFVRLEEDLRALLEKRVPEDREMLSAMSKAGASARVAGR